MFCERYLEDNSALTDTRGFSNILEYNHAQLTSTKHVSAHQTIEFHSELQTSNASKQQFHRWLELHSQTSCLEWFDYFWMDLVIQQCFLQYHKFCWILEVGKEIIINDQAHCGQLGCFKIKCFLKKVTKTLPVKKSLSANEHKPTVQRKQRYDACFLKYRCMMRETWWPQCAFHECVLWSKWLM